MCLITVVSTVTVTMSLAICAELLNSWLTCPRWTVAPAGIARINKRSSGPVPAFDPARLARKGAFLTRPSLAHYTQTRDEAGKTTAARSWIRDFESKTGQYWYANFIITVYLRFN